MLRWWWLAIIVIIHAHAPVHAAPSGQRSTDSAVAEITSIPASILLSAAVVVCFIIVVAACTCCQDELMGMKHDDAYSVGIEPPDRSTPGTPTMGRADFNSAVTVEPLPDIRRSSVAQLPRPPGYNHAINKGISAQDWFTGKFETRPSMENFPRHKLQYIREIKTGWFGNVIEGETSYPQRRKVVVKILREDVTSFDMTYFLHEAKMYRDLKHPNIMEFVGKCTDTEPYLLILEHSAFGDLKTYLLNHRAQSDQLIQSGALIKMSLDAAAGLCHLHDNNFVHYDFACRNCIVTDDNVVKIGDYGISPEIYKDDYTVVGETVVPLRWWAPESLDCNSNIITKELTNPANVWSFGVTLWEIIEFGKMPYMDLDAEAVIDKVYRQKGFRLSQPLTPVPKRDRIYEICQFCCAAEPQNRPSMKQVKTMLEYIFHNRQLVASPEFDRKWTSIVPQDAKSQTMVGSASPVPPDPALKKEVTFVAAEAAPTKPPRQLDDTVQQAQAPSLHAVPAAVPEQKANEDNAAREAKRAHILSLSDDDLAALSPAQLVDFYEFLSPEEISNLESRQQAALEQQERTQQRAEFLAMDPEGRERLSSDQLAAYMSCLSEAEQAEATRQQKAHQDRRRLLRMTSESQLLELTADDLDQASELLSPDELAELQRRIEQSQTHMQQKQQAKELLQASDRDLALLPDEELKDLLPWLASSDQIDVKERKERLRRKVDYILGSTGDALRGMDEHTFKEYTDLLSPDHLALVTRRLKDAEGEEAARQSWRGRLLALDGVELWQASQQDAFNEGLGYLEPEEQSTVLQRLEDVRNIREQLLSSQEIPGSSGPDAGKMAEYLTKTELEAVEGRRAQQAAEALRSEILDATGGALYALYKTRFDDFYPYLTAEERAGLAAEVERMDAQKRRHQDMPYPELAQVSEADLGPLRELCSEEEWSDLLQRRAEATRERDRIRNTLLTAEDLDLYLLLQSEGLSKFLPYLNDEEVVELSQRQASIEEMRGRLLHAEAEGLEDLGDETVLRRYLTPEEVDRIHQRKNEAMKAQEEKRTEILGAKDAELYHLYQDKWDDYFPYLSVEERAGVVGFVDNIREQRQRFLNMQDSELSQISPDQFEAARKYFDDSEFSALQGRWNAIQAERAAVRNEVLTADDATLWRMSQDGRLENAYANLSQEDVLRIAQTVDDCKKKREGVLGLSEYELAQIPPEAINEVMPLLSSEEQLELQDKLEQAANLEAETRAEEDRAFILSRSPLELALMPEDEVQVYADVLSEEEFGRLKLQRQEACEAREGILSLMDSTDPIDLDPEQLQRYHAYLSPEEIDALNQRVAASNAASPPQASDPNAFLQAPGTSMQQTSTPSGHSDPGVEKRRVDIAPLSLDHEMIEPLPSPIATPKHKSIYDANRSAILKLSDAELRSVPLQEVEAFHSFLSMDESYDLRDRVSRLKSEASNPVDAYGSPLSVKSSITSVLSGNDFGSPQLLLQPEHAQDFASPWQAREHMLQLPDEELAAMEEHELEEYEVYLSIDEICALKRRRDDYRNDKRQFLLHATDRDLQALSDNDRSSFLSFVDDPQEKRNISSRMEHAQTLSSVTSDSEIDLDKARDESAFKNYLSMTQVSLSTAPTDTEGGGGSASFQSPLSDPNSTGDALQKLMRAVDAANPALHDQPLVAADDVSDSDTVLMKHIGNVGSAVTPGISGQPLYEELKAAGQKDNEPALKHDTDEFASDEVAPKDGVATPKGKTVADGTPVVPAVTENKLDIVHTPDIPYYPEHQDEMAGWVITGQEDLVSPAGKPSDDKEPKRMYDDSKPVIDVEALPPPKVAPVLGPEEGEGDDTPVLLTESTEDITHGSLTAALEKAQLSPIPSHKSIAKGSAAGNAGVDLLDLFDPLVDHVASAESSKDDVSGAEGDTTFETAGSGEADSSLLVSAGDTSGLSGGDSKTSTIPADVSDELNQSFGGPFEPDVEVPPPFKVPAPRKSSAIKDALKAFEPDPAARKSSSSGSEVEVEEYEDVENPDGSISRVLVKRKVKRRYKPWSPVVTSSDLGGVSYQWVPGMERPDGENDGEGGPGVVESVHGAEGTKPEVKKRQVLPGDDNLIQSDSTRSAGESNAGVDN